jgi:hypothetical protein
MLFRIISDIESYPVRISTSDILRNKNKRFVLYFSKLNKQSLYAAIALDSGISSLTFIECNLRTVHLIY